MRSFTTLSECCCTGKLSVTGSMSSIVLLIMRRLISVDVKANIKQKKYKTNFLPSKLELECQKGVYLSFDLIFHLVGISSILVLSVKNRGGGRGICLMGKIC